MALAHYELAHVLQAQRLYREALERYRAALRLQPGAPEVHCALAIALEQLGGSRSRDHVTEALRLARTPSPRTPPWAVPSRRWAAAGSEGRVRAGAAPGSGLRPRRLALARIDVQLRLARARRMPALP